MSKAKAEKRKRFITVIGFLIVFMTFLVKDAIKEQVKDEVDTLESADSLFASTTASVGVFHLLVKIGKDVSALRKGITTARSALDDELGPNYVQAGLDIEILYRLINKLPEDELSLRNSLNDLRERRKSLDNLVEKLEKELSKREHFGRKLENEPDESLHDDLEKLDDDTQALQPDIDKLTAAALKRSDEIRHAEEQKLKRYTYLSYVLYAVGWSLAFYGRLAGVEGVEVG